MRICMTHYAFFPTTGGVESHLLDLCGELVRQGHEVFALVGSLEGREDHEEIDGVEIYRTDLMNPEWIREEKAKKNVAADEQDDELTESVCRMYERFLAEHAIDVVHGHNFHHFVPEHAMALTALNERGVPNILTVHEVWSEFICEDLLRRAKWDAVITFCKHVTKGIREQAPHLDNIEVIYPGIDVGLFNPENRDPKWADDLELHDRPVVIHPARMLPWKGVIYTVRAMRMVRDSVPEAALIITDTDDIVDWIRELQGYKQEVHSAIQALGLTENIIIQSFPYMELPWVYNYCDVVTYPTIGEEPFGLVPVEAMACAKPCVVTPSGGMVESVVDEETGYFVPKRDPEALAEKLIALLEDRDLAEQMGRKGRERAVEVFSRERMAKDTIRVYEQALAAHKNAPAAST